MNMCTIFVSIILLNIYSLNAAENSKMSVVSQYPFSTTDKILFHNVSTKKIESPYSTGSVLIFPKDEFVVIEKNAYDALLIYALQRSNRAVNTMDELYSKQEDNSELQCMICQIRLEAMHNNEQLKTVRPAEVTIYTVKLSQRNLMQILQWSNKITAVWLAMTDVFMEISLGELSVKAPPLLTSFIVATYTHVQGKFSRWFDDTV